MENYIDDTSSSVQFKKVNNKYPGPVAAGILFSLATILLTYGGFLINFNNGYLRSGIGELLFILLPALILLLAGRYNIKDTLKLNRTRPINYLIIVFLMMFAMPVVGVLNAIVLGIIRLIFGKNLPIPQLAIGDFPTLLAAILVVGVSAAVCEETLFRGLISKGYEKFGVVASLALTSILFGILHRDLQKAVSTMLLGAIIGYIVYRTNSIYTGMVAHFTNNTLAVILTFISQRMTENLERLGITQAGISDIANMPVASLVIAVIFYGLMFLGFLSAFIALFFAFYKSTQRDRKNTLFNTPQESELPPTINKAEYPGKYGILSIMSALPGVALILLTFTGQLLELMDITSGPIYNILRILALT